jgi:hypothetical protein
MVCFVCNGKGYVRINDHEMPCFECQGHGELPIRAAEQLNPLEPRIVRQAPMNERARVGI